MEVTKPEMTDQQRYIFQTFKTNVEDILTSYHTDDMLLKFLRARNFDLKKAEDNFRLTDSTRKLYFIDTYPGNFVMKEVFEKYRGDSFIGYAKDGTPIRYITLRYDFSGFLLAASAYDILRYICHLAECDLKATSEENSKGRRKNGEVTYIFDMEGYSLQDFTNKCMIETALDFFSLGQDVYPEIWRVILIINAPSIFDKLFYLVKPVLKENFLEKLRVANKSSSKELLRNYIDDDVLPAFLGGKRVDSKIDPYCKEFINQAGKIPEKFYLRNSTHFIDITDPDVKTALVRPRSVFNVPLLIKKARTKIRMEFRAENGSMIFSVLHRDIGPDSENPDFPEEDEILDCNDEQSNVRRISARVRGQIHLAPVDGDCIAINPGIYIMQFDNTGSWFGARKLFYRFTVLS